jgi:hypothetical protein
MNEELCKKLFQKALERFPGFWKGKKDLLQEVILNLSIEMKKFGEAGNKERNNCPIWESGHKFIIFLSICNLITRNNSDANQAVFL